MDRWAAQFLPKPDQTTISQDGKNNRFHEGMKHIAASAILDAQICELGNYPGVETVPTKATEFLPIRAAWKNDIERIVIVCGLHINLPGKKPAEINCQRERRITCGCKRQPGRTLRGEIS